MLVVATTLVTGDVRVHDADLTRVLEVVEELASKSPAEETEYWRGYKQGVSRRARGVAAEDDFQHRFWIGFSVRGRGTTGFEKYAAGYQDGFAEKDGPPNAELALLRVRLIAGETVSLPYAARRTAAPGAAMNCWEFMECGRERGGSREKELGVCPAYPDYGRSCARLIGTLCGGEVHGSMAKKLNDCMECPYFQSAHYERIRDKE